MPANSVFSPAQAVRQDRAAPLGSSFFGWLWSSYRKHRNVARLRNLAVEMDEHMLQDVGAPNWLINEAAVNRDLTRRRDVNYLRW
ncbi:hypothetical protein D9M68_811570 [compost metagenome]